VNETPQFHDSPSGYPPNILKTSNSANFPPHFINTPDFCKESAKLKPSNCHLLLLKGSSKTQRALLLANKRTAPRVQNPPLRRAIVTLTEYGPSYTDFTFTELKTSLRTRGIGGPRGDRKQMIRALREADRNATSRFLDFPPELRNLVYAELLTLPEEAQRSGTKSLSSFHSRDMQAGA
jgi:hypothetical protein